MAQYNLSCCNFGTVSGTELTSFWVTMTKRVDETFVIFYIIQSLQMLPFIMKYCVSGSASAKIRTFQRKTSYLFIVPCTYLFIFTAAEKELVTREYLVTAVVNIASCRSAYWYYIRVTVACPPRPRQISLKKINFMCPCRIARGRTFDVSGGAFQKTHTHRNGCALISNSHLW